MSASTSSTINVLQEDIAAALKIEGYTNAIKITNTLQGSIWRAHHSASGAGVVIKAANKTLHKNQLGIIRGIAHHVAENVLYEATILAHLTVGDSCPNSIIKFQDAFQTTANYYVAMDDGGQCLFAFVAKAFGFIRANELEISEWLKICKLLFKQMIEAVEYIHFKKVAHFDISLENFLINDVKIKLVPDKYGNKKIKFEFNQCIQCKLCDFGLASYFRDGKFISSKYCGKPGYKSPEITEQKKQFDAKANDIWCLGVSLFKLVCGCNPFKDSVKGDKTFDLIMDGKIDYVLKIWRKDRLVDDDLLKLFNGVFQNEQDRITLNDIKMNPWLTGSDELTAKCK